MGQNLTVWSANDCKMCITERRGECNKGDFGYVALIGGSLRYCGAAKLANIAACAMRGGAGVVKLAVPESVAHAVLPYLLESTLFPLADDGGKIAFDPKQIEELTANVQTVAFGMGVGMCKGAADTLNYLLRRFDKTLIVDADGLNCLAQTGVDALLDRKPKVILTPHVKEFSRLCGHTVADIKTNGIALAEQFAERYGVIVLLKGATTAVTDGSTTILVQRGCAGMATAGSGDVLNGILAAVCAYNSDRLLEATATAAYVNGLAGELAERETNSVSMLSGDTARNVALAVSRILCE